MSVWSPLSPLIIIVLAVCFAGLSYRFYEKKTALFLKRKFAGQAEKKISITL